MHLSLSVGRQRRGCPLNTTPVSANMRRTAENNSDLRCDNGPGDHNFRSLGYTRRLRCVNRSLPSSLSFSRCSSRSSSLPWLSGRSGGKR